MRYGKILVSNAIRRDGELWRMFDSIDFTPMFIDTRITSGSTLYHGMSYRFDDIATGEVTPEYQVSVDRENKTTVERIAE